MISAFILGCASTGNTEAESENTGTANSGDITIEVLNQ